MLAQPLDIQGQSFYSRWFHHHSMDSQTNNFRDFNQLEHSSIKNRSVSPLIDKAKNKRNTLNLDKKEIKRLYLKEKLSQQKLADKFNCSRSYIGKILKKEGILISRYFQQIKELRYRLGNNTKEIIILYTDKKLNLGTSKIAKKFNCSPFIIKKILKENNIETKRKPYRINLDEIKIIKLYIKEKLSMQTIANKFGCSFTVIYKILERNNIMRRNKKYNLNEIQLLKNIDYSFKELGLKLNRSLKGISVKCSELKIKRGHIKYRLTEEMQKPSFNLGYISGILCGDGNIQLYHKAGLIRLGSPEKEFILKFYNILEKWSNITPSIVFSKKSYQYNVSIWSLEICKYFFKICNKQKSLNHRTYSWEVPKIIINGNNEVQKGFIQAFFDSEGTVGSRFISSCNVNLKGLTQIKDILEKNFKIKCSIHYRKSLDIYYLNISNQINLDIFFKKIGFSLLRKQKKLNKILLNCKTKRYTLSIYRKALELSTKNLPINEIIKILNISYYTYHNWINKNKKPQGILI